MNPLLPALLVVLAFAAAPLATADGPVPGLGVTTCVETDLLPPPPEVDVDPSCALGALLPP